ncbi:MAG: hypothetical protein V8Q77_05555 [Bacilli bacterium]
MDKLANQILYSSEYQISEYDKSSFKSFAYDYLLMNSIIIGDKYYDIVCCEGIDLRAGKIGYSRLLHFRPTIC